MANPQGQELQGQPKEFKSQPWVLFDSIVSPSFLMGSPVNAIGATTPAISSSGEMMFFNSPGRTRANMPWYTNLDTPGILSYGLEVWQIYLSFEFPAFPPTQNVGFDLSLNPGVPGTIKLMEAILNFGALDMTLGQENQTVWPLSRFGAGGGLAMSASVAAVVGQNSQPQSMNVMKLPEPIEMPRTMNIDAKIRLAPEIFALIGNPVAPGVGSPLTPYIYGIATTEVPVDVPLAQPPFKIQLGLVGRRVKKTQYGQLPA
jgi:hypothetical protein